MGYFLPCPEKGSFTAYKKVDKYIVELKIPAKAKRSSASGRKCRASFAKVLRILNGDGSSTHFTSIINRAFNKQTTYTIGKKVFPDSFDNDRWNECSNGIHFFITFDEAKNY